MTRRDEMPADLVVTDDGIGRLLPDGTIEVVDSPYPDLGALLRAEHTLAPALEAAAVGSRRWDDVTLRPPLGAALQWGVGLNTKSKAERTGRSAPEFPTLFVKPGTATACPGAPVPLPGHVSSEFDFEGEIAVVIGAPVWRASPDDALTRVVAFTAANDFTARDVMRRTGNPTLAKGFPGTAGLGPALRPWTDTARPTSIRTMMNGVVRQASTLADLMLGVGELIAVLSTYVELGPGDVVLMGSPAGTGDEDGRHLRAGDVVSVQVDDLPPLVHEVLAEDLVGI